MSFGSWENLNITEVGRAPVPFKHPNKKIAGKALANTVPILSVQTVLAFVPMMLYDDAEEQTSPPPLFLLPHYQRLDGCADRRLEEDLPVNG